MATQYSPKMVSDGLILCLDAANRKSYPGSGTTWSDLSGNGNNGNLIGGPTFSNSNGGVIVFDGSNDYVSIANSTSLRPSTEVTIECVIRPASTPGGWTQIFGYGGGGSNYQLGNYLVFLETGTTIVRGLARVNNTEYRCNTNYTAPVNTYTFITFTMKTGDAIRSYFNGVADITTSLPAGTFTYLGTTGPYEIGYPGAGGSWLIGEMPFMKVYNRALTPQEILQNFNATRSRFGI